MLIISHFNVETFEQTLPLIAGPEPELSPLFIILYFIFELKNISLVITPSILSPSISPPFAK